MPAPYSYDPAAVNALLLPVASGTNSFVLSSNDEAVINTMVADITASSSAEAQLLVQTTAQMTVNAVFQVVASEAQSVALLNAFHVESNDASSPTAEIKVDMSADAARVDAFKLALGELIQKAAADAGTQSHGALDINSTGVMTDNMNKYFAELLRAYVNADLETDGFNNLLEAGVVSSILAVTDASGGSVAMHTEMNDAANDVKRISLIRQNDERDLEEYYGYMAEVAAADAAEFAPMKGGKTLTFIFDAQLTDPSTITLRGPDAATSANSGGGYTAALNGKIVGNASTNLHADESRIAIIVQLADKDAYFVRDISQAAVAVGAAPAGTSAEQAAWYEAQYLAQPTGLCVASKITTDYGYVLPVSAPADARDLGYYNAVGKYIAARGSASTKAIASALPTIA